MLDSISPRKAFLYSFVLGVGVRLIPEVLAFSYPIGFDTVYYGERIMSGVVWEHWSSVFTCSWLLYGLTVPLYNVLHLDHFLLLKIVGSLLYGINVAGIFYFARRGLGWGTEMGLFSAGFFALQVAALRISWDLLRNTLGLGVLLFALPLIGRFKSKRAFMAFMVLSLVVVFAHQYAAVILFSLVLWMVVRSLWNHDWRRYLWMVLAGLPAFMIFLTGVYLGMFPVHNVAETNVIEAGDVVQGRVGNLFFLVNHLGANDGVHYHPCYTDLALDVLVLFMFLYLPYLYLVWKGFFREERLDGWVGLSVFGAFGCLIIPHFALLAWNRWMFMLAYPFTFYAMNGLKTVLSSQSDRKSGVGEGFRLKNLKTISVRVKGMLLITILLGSLYLVSPILVSSFGGSVASVPPVSGYISCAPTVPYQDVDDTVEAMKWLDTNMDEDSCVLLHHAFVGWATLYLGESHKIVRFHIDGDKALKSALELGFTTVYFVWWIEDINWYQTDELPSELMKVQDYGRISVFEVGAQYS